MNNTNESLEFKTKNITLGLVVGWIIGVLCLIAGVIYLFSEPLIGIIYLVIACIAPPPLNKYIQSKTHLKLSRSIKIILVLLLMICSGIIAGSNGKSTVSNLSNGNVNNLPTVPVKPVEVIKVSAIKLFSDYKNNEVSADEKYKGKFIDVSGQIGTIGKDITDTPYVTLSADQYGIDSVQCMFSQSDVSELSNLSKGQQITLQGEVSGKMMNVLVSGCQIIK